MSNDDLVQIIALVGMVMFSAFFSSSETAFSSLNRIRIKNYAMSGNKRAQKTLGIVEHFDKALSAILIGNNIVNIAATSICTVLFTNKLGASGAGIATVVMTLVLLTFGEISPKTLAKERPEAVALSCTPLLYLFIKILTPFIWMFSGLNKLLARLLKSESSPSMTGEELLVMIDEIENEGTLDKKESDLIKSAIEFDDITVTEILVPRVNIISSDAKATIEELKEIFLENGFSRIPIYDEDIDSILGVIHEKDFFAAYITKKDDIDVSTLIKPLVFVPESLKISSLLATLQREKSHMAVVVDQYGGTKGIVTLEDILEELVGDIYDESDEEEEMAVSNEDGSITVSGEYSIIDLLEKFEVIFDYDEINNHSVAGFASSVLGRVPEAGDKISYAGIEFEVTKADERRAREIRLILKSNDEESK